MGQESKIEKAMVKYARSKGCYVRKFSSPSHRGVPDQIFLTPAGVVFFIEFKASGKEPTALQKRELQEIINHKGNAGWVDDIDCGKTVVDQYLRIKVL